MIPEEKSAAVSRALDEVFGVTEIEDIRRITKGHNFALIFRIVVKGSPYLLRIIMRPNTMIGPERELTCMKAAADAGLAPRIWYTNMADGISITDFVEEVAFPASEALVRMPAALRTLHALPPFPGVVHQFNTTCMFLINPGPALDEFIQKFQETNILSKDEIEELLAWHAQLIAVYPRDGEDMVSSHNDLFKPDNILFDGQRVWLVDWEAAFLNDRYADLAVLANLIVTSDEDERAYLAAYFGQPPDEYQLARLFLMRQIAHMFYAMLFLLLGSAGKPVDRSESLPELKDFQPRMWAGEIDLKDNDAKVLFGRIHYEQLVRNMRHERFNEALRIVSNGAFRRAILHS